MLQGRSIVNITETVQKYVAEQGIAAEEALKKGMGQSRKSLWKRARLGT